MVALMSAYQLDRFERQDTFRISHPDAFFVELSDSERGVKFNPLDWDLEIALREHKPDDTDGASDNVHDHLLFSREDSWALLHEKMLAADPNGRSITAEMLTPSEAMRWCMDNAEDVPERLLGDAGEVFGNRNGGGDVNQSKGVRIDLRSGVEHTFVSDDEWEDLTMGPRTRWFQNSDVRDPRIRCWPDEFVYFLGEEFSCGIRRDREILAEAIWVLSNSLRGTFFVARLRQFVAESEENIKRSNSLEPADFRPPVLPRDLYAARLAEKERWKLCGRFSAVFLRCVELDLSIAEVQEHLCSFFELSPGRIECEALRDEMLELLDWTLADVDIGKPVGADIAATEAGPNRLPQEALSLGSIVDLLAKRLAGDGRVLAEHKAAAEMIEAVSKSPQLVNKSLDDWALRLSRGKQTVSAGRDIAQRNPVWRSAMGAAVSSDTAKKNQGRRMT